MNKRPISLEVNQRDGSIWSVPVEFIARNRAEYYKSEFGGDVERSLAEDTWPLFEDSHYVVQDWAISNMSWEDFGNLPVCVEVASPPLTLRDFEFAWINGEKVVR